MMTFARLFLLQRCSAPPAGSPLDPQESCRPTRTRLRLSAWYRLRAPGFALLPFAALPAAALLFGCGQPGTPQPPSLKLPVPPTDLTAVRSGDAVTLRWTMPRRATDRVLLTGDQRAVVCRSLGLPQPQPAAATASVAAGIQPGPTPNSAPCTPAASLLLSPGSVALYLDRLPAQLTVGPPRLLTYSVLLENRAQRSAGASNPAWTAAGAGPPRIEALTATPGPSGITLHWQPSPGSSVSAGASISAGNMTAPGAALPARAMYWIRLHRTRLFAAGESPRPTSEETRSGVPQPVEQTLETTPTASGPAAELDAGWTGRSLDHALDRAAALNRTYRYRVERVARLTLDGHPIEIAGPLSEPVTVDARDLFPPQVPQGLDAVADNEGGAIDLSWSPDTDADLAGYFVYRRLAESPAPPIRVSGPAPLPNAAWRDLTVQTGVRYAYSVSAVDTSANESARSDEVQETMQATDTPQKPDKNDQPHPQASPQK